jgi:AraC family transcriptional regulator, regulatory protein of adaptative response / methylated-DNA-[protein]-cysteine methyltransferase
METQNSLNYKRIAEAITYIKTNFKNQPSLDELAEKVNLSPFHFQRLFTEWAGTSPKNFLQYITIAHAKSILKNTNASLFETTFESGLSSTARLHDLFIKIEGMSPAEYKNGGKNLTINYSFAESRFGQTIMASTTKGLCYLMFYENENQAFEALQNHFPNAVFSLNSDDFQAAAQKALSGDWKNIEQLKLHLKGTDFQLKIWETLLKIPQGGLTTYGKIANKIENPNASRAVGTAIGSNPVAFLIPCHRVILGSGELGGYMWGPTRKTAIIGWEAASLEIAV